LAESPAVARAFSSAAFPEQGAGTAVAGLTGNADINIATESLVRFRLAQDLVLQPS